MNKTHVRLIDADDSVLNDTNCSIVSFRFSIFAVLQHAYKEEHGEKVLTAVPDSPI